MTSIFDKILKEKKIEIKKQKELEPLDVLKDKSFSRTMPPTRDFKSAIRRTNGLNIIAEIKKSSPSQGGITNKDAITIAKIYEKSRADAISVLTDKNFGGCIHDLGKVKEHTTKPILRKDFIIDEYQIYQSRTYGADAILLIVRILTDKNLRHFIHLSKELGMESLVECHTTDEIRRVPLDANIFGINNRRLISLGTYSNNFRFETKLDVTKELIDKIPKGKIIVSESGIKQRKDIEFLENLSRRVDAVLTGTSILRTPDSELEQINILKGH